MVVGDERSRDKMCHTNWSHVEHYHSSPMHVKPRVPHEEHICVFSVRTFSPNIHRAQIRIYQLSVKQNTILIFNEGHYKILHKHHAEGSQPISL